MSSQRTAPEVWIDEGEYADGEIKETWRLRGERRRIVQSSQADSKRPSSLLSSKRTSFETDHILCSQTLETGVWIYK